MNTREDAQAIVDILNDLYCVDESAASLLVETRHPCNDGVVNHPDFIACESEGQWRIGFLGIINSLFDSTHRVAANYDDEHKLVGFNVCDFSVREEEVTNA